MTITNKILKQQTVKWRELVWFQSEALKTLSSASMEKLKSSLRNNQFVQPFNVWDDGRRVFILDGHHRQKAMRELEAEGCVLPDELPANFVDCASRKEAGKMVLVYSSIYAKIAQDGLTAFAVDIGLDLDDIALEIDLPELDIDALLDLSPENGDVEETETPALQAEPVTRRGDVYGLGRHRLLCGDSTSADDVARLMDNTVAAMLFTDPPYNINYAEFNANVREGGKDWSGVYCNEWKDSMSDEDYALFLAAFLRNAKRHLLPYAHYYVWYASLYHHTVCKAFELNDISYMKSPILWLKNTFPISWVHYKHKFEPCIFGGKDSVVGTSENGKARWFGGNAETDVWEIPRDFTNNYVHPTQKPVALAARAITNSSAAHEIVLDLFGGSGSTMLAAEQLGRTAHLMEYEPAFCDVIVRRYIGYCHTAGIPCIVTRNGIVANLDDFALQNNDEHDNAPQNATTAL
jgi:DNA modification methylase